MTLKKVRKTKKLNMGLVQKELKIGKKETNLFEAMDNVFRLKNWEERAVLRVSKIDIRGLYRPIRLSNL